MRDGDRVDRLVGGSLATLLYQVQLGTISVDPWHARVNSSTFADYSVIDLDPGPRAKFERVVEVATWVKEELDRLGLHAALKTSGSSGLHIFLPLPPRTSNEAALLVAQIVATRVAQAHPTEATVERAVSARPKATVYVDYLQNVLGKSVGRGVRRPRPPGCDGVDAAGLERADAEARPTRLHDRDGRRALWSRRRLVGRGDGGTQYRWRAQGPDEALG